MVQTIIINQSNIEAIQPMSVSTEKIKSAVANSSLLPSATPLTLGHSSEFDGSRSIAAFTIHFSLKSIYRKELRMARAAARVIDAYPTLSNIALWLMGIGIIVEVFLFA